MNTKLEKGDDGQWYFWNEVDTDRYGPYKTIEEADMRYYEELEKT